MTDQPAPRTAAARALTSEVGSSGTYLFGGFIQRDYLPQLNGQRAIDTYDEMRRSDGQVQAALLVWELPIRAAAWYVEPSDPEDARAVEIADFVSYNLFEYGEAAWQPFLYQALTCLPFGFSLFEKVLAPLPAPHAGRLGWRKFAYRSQKSVWRWLTDEHHGLTGIEQLALGMPAPVVLPAEKLLLFTHRREGDNYEGTSVLRAAYKHWYVKSALYKLQAIALERNGVGVPLAQWKRGTLDPATVSKIEQLVQTLRVGSEVGVTLPEEVKLSILSASGVQGAVAAFQQAIQHHDELIARSLLSGFLSMGQGGSGGAYALGQTLTDLLLVALDAVADTISDELNLHAIPQLVDLNYGPQDAYPKLRHGPVGLGAGANDGAVTDEQGDEIATPEPGSGADAAPADGADGLPKERQGELTVMAREVSSGTLASRLAATATERRVLREQQGGQRHAERPSAYLRRLRLAAITSYPPVRRSTVRVAPGGFDPLPSDDVKVTPAQVNAAIDRWDRTLPQYAGLLDAEVRR